MALSGYILAAPAAYAQTLSRCTGDETASARTVSGRVTRSNPTDSVTVTNAPGGSIVTLFTRRDPAPTVSNRSRLQFTLSGSASFSPSSFNSGFLNRGQSATRTVTVGASGGVRVAMRAFQTGSGNGAIRQSWRITCTPPDIGVRSRETSSTIVDGGSDPHGTETVGEPKTVVYEITNTLGGTLNLTGALTISGLNNVSNATISTPPGVTSLASGRTTTFAVTYTPTNPGPFSFDINIPNNDPSTIASESSFGIAVSGNANATPSVVLSGPSTPQAGPFTVTATFSEAVSGLDVSEFVVSNGVASGLILVSPGVYTFTVTPTDPSAAVSISLPAGTAEDADGAVNAASNVLVTAGGALTPEQQEGIREITVEETTRDLRQEISVNRRANRAARDRHAAAQRCRFLQDDLDEGRVSTADFEQECGADFVSRQNVPFGVNGVLSATQSDTSLLGSFFSQSSTADGRRRLVFGEFDVTRYDDEDVTATLSGRVAWERLVREDVLWGIFVGANLSQTRISGALPGDRTGVGLTLGTYFVDQLEPDLFLDGFAAVSAGRNSLELSTGTAIAEGDYNTTSLQLGIALSGLREYERFDLRPELSLSYGYADISDAPLSVAVGGSTLSDAVAAGYASYGNVEFRPEFIFEPEQIAPIGLKGTWYDESWIIVAPHVSCEVTDSGVSSNACGGGLELEWTAQSHDGLWEFSARMSRDVIGGVSRDSIGLQFESEF